MLYRFKVVLVAAIMASSFTETACMRMLTKNLNKQMVSQTIKEIASFARAHKYKTAGVITLCGLGGAYYWRSCKLAAKANKNYNPGTLRVQLKQVQEDMSPLQATLSDIKQKYQEHSKNIPFDFQELEKLVVSDESDDEQGDEVFDCEIEVVLGKVTEEHLGSKYHKLQQEAGIYLDNLVAIIKALKIVLADTSAAYTMSGHRETFLQSEAAIKYYKKQVPDVLWQRHAQYRKNIEREYHRLLGEELKAEAALKQRIDQFAERQNKLKELYPGFVKHVALPMEKWSQGFKDALIACGVMREAGKRCVVDSLLNMVWPNFGLQEFDNRALVRDAIIDYMRNLNHVISILESGINDREVRHITKETMAKLVSCEDAFIERAGIIISDQ